MMNITPKTGITEEIMKRAKKRHRRNTWLTLILTVLMAVGIALLFVGAVNEFYSEGARVYAATKSSVTVSKGHCKKGWEDPVRERKAVIVRTQKVRGIDTDCINAQQMKYVTLNTAVDTDGEIWKFYTTRGSKPKYRTFKYEVVNLWIFNNHTKKVNDDEVIGVGSHCMVR